MPTCQNCKKEFPNKIKINGEIFNLNGRKFCPSCSPVGGRNTRSYIVKTEENESFCSHCKQIKNKSEFYSRKNNGKSFSYCIACQEEVKKLKLEEKLSQIIELRGGACQDCNNVFPASVYDFYSEENVFHISKAKNMSLEKLLIKLSAYIMICKNCCAIRKWEKNQF